MKTKEIRKPYLVQRAKFTNVKNEEIVGIDSILDFDYMGSAEFEWGALPKSLHRIVDVFDQYEVFTVNEVKDHEGSSMKVYCKNEFFDQVKENALHLSINPYGYKEFCDMKDYISGKKNTNNFWWDIKQDYFIFFGKNKGKKVEIAMQKLKEKWSK